MVNKQTIQTKNAYRLMNHRNWLPHRSLKAMKFCIPTQNHLVIRRCKDQSLFLMGTMVHIQGNLKVADSQLLNSDKIFVRSNLNRFYVIQT